MGSWQLWVLVAYCFNVTTGIWRQQVLRVAGVGVAETLNLLWAIMAQPLLIRLNRTQFSVK